MCREERNIRIFAALWFLLSIAVLIGAVIVGAI